MKKDICVKLAIELSEPIDSERQVVYILVELRKLIELNGDGEHYKSLKLHCDWAAHPKLTGLAAQEIVRLFDRFQGMFDKMEAMHPGEARPSDDSFMAALGPILTMTNFRNELIAYLVRQDLDSSFASENAKWVNFLHYYAAVIEDCPLRCIGQGLKHTDEVLLRAQEVRPDTREATHFRIFIEWSWKSKKDGLVHLNRQFY